MDFRAETSIMKSLFKGDDSSMWETLLCLSVLVLCCILCVLNYSSNGDKDNE